VNRQYCFMCLRTLDIFKSNAIQSRILSQHSQNTVQVNTLHATLKCLMFSVCVTSLWRVMLSASRSPLVHMIVNIPPAPHQSSHHHARIFSWSVDCTTYESTRRWRKYVTLKLWDLLTGLTHGHTRNSIVMRKSPRQNNLLIENLLIL
jgi:hypothetical protein